MKWSILALSLFLVLGAAPAHAEVGFDIHIGNMPQAAPPAPPPTIVVSEPPEMVFVPEIGFYVAIGIPYDVVYVDSRYYYYQGGAWFVSPYYSGPWVYAGPKRLPPGLRRYKIERIHEIREVAWRDYKEHGPKFKEKHFQGKGPDHWKHGKEGKGGGHGKRHDD